MKMTSPPVSTQEAPSFVAARDKFNHSHTDGNGDRDSDFLLLLCESQATLGLACVVALYYCPCMLYWNRYHARCICC